ncbi:unnamed protein product [Larinioides sclopetarius]|uniref:Aminotransferase class I/classII large domain-containing protein n=1 Tax=Larinioides sclopetarius TaxID=280406 RepID=A0AAV1ZJ09_9ARAC
MIRHVNRLRTLENRVSKFHKHGISQSVIVGEADISSPYFQVKRNMAYDGPAKRLQGMQESVWVEFIQLALDYKPVNLGQGFPDFAAPAHVTKALSDAVLSPNVLLNQYTRGFGHPRLVNALSKLYTQLIGREVNPQKEILVTVGAYEALYCTILGLVNPGDELTNNVHFCHKLYNCFFLLKQKKGGVSSSDWYLDPKELASKFNKKTKMIIVNTPHNPLGKIFTKDELLMIADLCKKHDVIAVMDEVYEWLVYKGHEHIRMATLPGMWERTVTIGSAGKTFSATGWKIGWAYGPDTLISILQLVFAQFQRACCTPLQEAVAVGFETEIERLGKPGSYWQELAEMLEKKRDKMVKFLSEIDMAPVIPDGGYFMIADFSALASKVNIEGESGTKDYKFAKWLSKNKKLQGIPPSAFYGNEDKHLAENLIRFCFIKEDTTLEAAEKIINDLKKSL